MSSQSSKTSSAFTFISSLILVLLHVTTGSGAYPPLWKHCPSSPNYSINSSTFGTNLRLLLSSLPSNASATTTGFANRTVGHAPNRVYGLAQCRGDATGDKCLQCLNTTREELPSACLNRTGAVWYDNCLMRYSDRQISSTSDNSPVFFLWSLNNVTDPTGFTHLLGGLMAGLVSKATSVPSGAPLYATDQANFTSFRTLYGLAQCNSNILATSDCRRCLEGAVGQIPVCCEGRQGGRVIGANCNVRFELYKFYEDLALAVPQPSPPPTNRTTSSMDIRVIYQFREGNQAADVLAKQGELGSNVVYEDFQLLPRFLRGVIRIDKVEMEAHLKLPPSLLSLFL